MILFICSHMERATAPAADPASQARQPERYDAGPQPPAAEDQHLRAPDSADLRQLAPAAPGPSVSSPAIRFRQDTKLGAFIIQALNQYLGHGKADLHMILYALGIMFFSFSTAVVFNPEKRRTT